MTIQDEQDWLGANQRHLSLEIAMLRTELTRHAARADGHHEPEGGRSEFEALREERRTIQERMPRPPALDDLCARFSLTPFERQLLLLTAAVELDSAFGALCAHAHGDTQRAYPTFGLALAALHDPHWSALLPNAALRYWHLIDFASPGGSPSAPLTS